MVTELEQKAAEAFIDDDLDLAVELYTQAISLNPNAANLFADRAQASFKLKNFTEAVVDADRAIELDSSMVKAYLRKGAACIKLGEYHTAKAALEVGGSFAQNDVRFTKLIKECDERISDETQQLLPKKPASTALASLPQSLYSPTTETNEAGKNASPQMNKPATAKPKHEFYQKPEQVVVTVYAKGIAAKDVVVDFGDQVLSVTVDTHHENVYHLRLRLFGKILPEKCHYEVLSTKIEIRLAKAEAIHWTSLEFNKETSVGSPRPTYPSSRNARDWDKLEAQVKREEKEEVPEGDAGVNKFFRQMYQDADEDTRRAMSKSYLESNGTVLSTDWKEVVSKKIEVSAPDGMELKDWEK